MTADYKANPENYYGMLKAIDEEEFDYINAIALSSCRQTRLLDGKIAIVKYDGSEIPEEYLGQPVHFLYQDQPYEITVGAVTYETYYSGTNIGAHADPSARNYLKRLTTRPTTLSVSIHYDKEYDETLEQNITSLLEQSPYSNRPLRRITLRKHENHTGHPRAA